MNKKLYLVRVASGVMGRKDDFSFTTDISGYPDSPYIDIYEARKLTKKERKSLTKQNKKK